MTGFTPPLIAQLDGSPMAGLNCGLTRTAMAVMDARAGIPHPDLPWPPTGATMRTLSGDAEGGTRLTQHKALAALYGVDIELRLNAPFDDVWAEHEAGKGLLLDIGYDAIPDPWRGSATFRGNHGILVLEGTFDPLYDGRRPGIPDGPQPVPRNVLRRAAGALNMGSTEKPRPLGEGRCYAGLYDSGTVAPAPPLTFELGGNAMISLTAGDVTTLKRKAVPARTPLFREPGGPRITSTRADRPISHLPYIGYAGSVDGTGYQLVLTTTSNFKDGVARTVGLYARFADGPVS